VSEEDAEAAARQYAALAPAWADLVAVDTAPLTEAA
jgi:hypothetical protein